MWGCCLVAAGVAWVLVKPQVTWTLVVAVAGDSARAGSADGSPAPALYTRLDHLYTPSSPPHLASCSIAVSDASTAQWLFSSTDPLFHCWMVNTYLLLMVVVVLPLLLLWQLEQRARWRFHLQHLQQQQQSWQQQQQGWQQQGWQPLASHPQPHQPLPQVPPLTPDEQLRLLGSLRPGWAAAADVLLFSCAAWALVCLWAAARGFRWRPASPSQ